MGSYIRVLPRDLFNESGLLKCVARLWILTENGDHTAKFHDEDMPAFEIEQSDDDGSIYIGNLTFSIDGAIHRLYRPLNSRSPWPLYAQNIDDYNADAIPVFRDDSELSDEMRAAIGLPNPELISVESMFLYAVNTGEFYTFHKDTAWLTSQPNQTGHQLWWNHVEDTVIPTYRKENHHPKARMSARDKELLADKLRKYYERHITEI